MIEAAVEHFALRPEALFAAVVAGPERADQDIARNFVQIGSAGEQPVEDRADAADFLNGFVGDVNDSLHEYDLSLQSDIGKSFSRSDADVLGQTKSDVKRLGSR